MYSDDDPTSARHKDSTALGLPYWAWEAWDGLTLPQQVTNPIYTVKEDKWANRGFGKGATFANPFHRWFAPVSLHDQVSEYFPATLTDDNSTTRSAAFFDPSLSHMMKWTVAPSTPADPSMEDNVHSAIANKHWMTFCTTGGSQSDEEDQVWGNGGGSMSIENPHNKFHNRIGGITQGGIQGPGPQWYFVDGKYSAQKIKKANQRAETNENDPRVEQQYVGTMTSNQSIFDPIFWLHHGNIERQLMSWQYLWANEDVDDVSKPPDALMKTVLYPWTKPQKLYVGSESWNTPNDVKNNATFADWWDWRSLPYKYDDLISPFLAESAVAPQEAEAFLRAVPMDRMLKDATTSSPVRVTVEIERKYFVFGDFDLYLGSKLLGTTSILSAQGSVCARCNNHRNLPKLHFEVSRTLGNLKESQNALGNLTLTRNGNPVPIASSKASLWYLSSAKTAGTASKKRKASSK